MVNYSYNTTDTTIKADRFYRDLLAPTIFLGCLAVFGLFGNILVLIVFGLKENPSVYRTVILTLALYDTLLCGITLPFEVYDLHNQYTFQAPEWVCKLIRTINYCLVFNSGFTVLLMTVDRFRRVRRPLNVQMTLRGARGGLLSILLISIVFTLPNIWIRGIHTIPLGRNMTGYDCTISDDYINSKVPMIYFSILLIICTLGIIILIILYIMIGHKIIIQYRYRRKFLSAYLNQEISVSTISSQNVTIKTTDIEMTNNTEALYQQSSSTNKKSIKRGNKKRTVSSNKQFRKYSGKKTDEKGFKATKIAIVISTMYILSYVPSLIENILEAVYGIDILKSYVSSSVLHLLRRAFAINHVINPIVYGFIDEKFRKNCTTVIMVGCKTKQTPNL